MASVAVVTSSPPGVHGGHLVIADALVAALSERGHVASLVTTPECHFGRQASAYVDTWRMNIAAAAGRPVDQVISLRFPSYAIRHERHVCWLNHTMREYYDLWSRFVAPLSPQNKVKELVKRSVARGVDRMLLNRIAKRLTISNTVRRRLETYIGVHADALWPPPPPRPYRCERYGDYVFAVSRLTPLKRMDLLIRALAEPAAHHVRAVIAGEGEDRAHLQQLSAELQVDSRTTFVGRADDAMLVDHLARCRAVCFTPYDEDYGFVTVEAFASAKPVITCSDSGGPTELVRDGHNGFVVEPTPPAVAAALARLADDPALAETMGQRGRDQAAKMTWADAVDRLLIV